jgi:hypothetical protein
MVLILCLVSLMLIFLEKIIEILMILKEERGWYYSKFKACIYYSVVKYVTNILNKTI